MDNHAINVARSVYYGLFSKMFVFTPNIDRFEGIDEALSILIKNPLDENSGEALKEIKEFIQAYGNKGLSDEFDDIFSNPTTQTVRDTASFYDEAVESGKKRVEVKNFLAKTRIRRNEKVFKDNEDSVGFLVTFMHELIELVIRGENQYETVEHCLYTEIINEFIDEFIIALYEHEKASAYKSLAIVLNAFIEFERLYFKVQKPKAKKIVTKKEEVKEVISDAEAKRRAENRKKREGDLLHSSCKLDDVFTGTEEEGDL